MGIIDLVRKLSGSEPGYVAAESMVGSYVSKAKKDESSLVFETDRGVYAFGHRQDCCEEVVLEEVNIDMSTVSGLVTRADESTSREPIPDDAWGVSCTWTFYRFCVGGQDFEARWFGQSSGYYSESVDVMLSPKGD